jgi:hypothetical protein
VVLASKAGAFTVKHRPAGGSDSASAAERQA